MSTVGIFRRGSFMTRAGARAESTERQGTGVGGEAHLAAQVSGEVPGLHWLSLKDMQRPVWRGMHAQGKGSGERHQHQPPTVYHTHMRVLS